MKKYYLKERNNLQAPIYYVMEGQLSKNEAIKHSRSLAGYNRMLAFDTEKEYLDKIEELKKLKYNIH